MKVTRADWAASVPASGITGVISPDNLPAGGGGGGVTDIGQLKAAGFGNGKIPVWNSSLGKFLPGSLPAPPSPTPGSDIIDFNVPGVATRMRPVSGPTVDLWLQEVFDLRQYGGIGDNATDNFDAISALIADLNFTGGGCLYLPAAPSAYYLSSSPPEITVPCSVYGDGWGVSKLRVPNAGLVGGAGGNWFEVGGLSLLSDGTGGTGIMLSDGSASGDNFYFHDLTVDGFTECIAVNATARHGFVRTCRINPLATGLGLTAAGSEISGCIFSNLGDNSAVGLSLNGSDHLVHGLRLLGTSARWARAIDVLSGGNVLLANMLIESVQGAMINLATTGRVRVQNISFLDVIGDPPVVFNPLIHYVNELHGLGSNTNTSYDQRKELETQTTWNPDSIRSLESTTTDVTLTGARVGDQVVLGTPDATDYLQQTARVVADDTVRITITNLSLNTVDLPSATYKVRIFN